MQKLDAKNRKAFYSGFKDVVRFMINTHSMEHLGAGSRSRLQSYDSSYLQESGDLVRIGKDMREAINDAVNER